MAIDLEVLDKVGATDAEIKTISKLVSSLEDLQGELLTMEEMLKDKKATLRKLQEELLPEAMDAANTTEFTTTTGVKVILKDSIKANITKANEEQAFAWLRENGHGDLIKRELKVKFDAGEDNLAGDVKALMEEKTGHVPEDKTAVAWNTLTSFVKEALSNGQTIPMDILGVFRARKVEIKGKK